MHLPILHSRLLVGFHTLFIYSRLNCNLEKGTHPTYVILFLQSFGSEIKLVLDDDSSHPWWWFLSNSFLVEGEKKNYSKKNGCVFHWNWKKGNFCWNATTLSWSQCDQNWRNFTTLENIFKNGKYLWSIWFWAKFSAHFGTFSLLKLLKMAKYWKHNPVIWSHWLKRKWWFVFELVFEPKCSKWHL